MKSTVLVVRANNISSLLLAEQLNRLDYLSWSSAANPDSITEALADISPEFAIVDIDTNCTKSIDVIRSLRRQSPLTKCVAFIAVASGSLPILSEDASGYLSNQATLDELKVCLVQLSNGCKYISPELNQTVVLSNLETKPHHAIWDSLTKREKEILTLLSKGYTNQKIANTIYRSPKTVSAIKYTLVKKLNLRTAHELLHFAMTVCKN